MLKKLQQKPRQEGKIKTVTLLLGVYFSSLLLMVTFTGFFVYSNLSAPIHSVAATSSQKQSDNKAILNKEEKNTDPSSSKDDAALKAIK